MCLGQAYKLYMEKYSSKDQKLHVKLLLRSCSCPFEVEVGRKIEAIKSL